MGQFSPERFGMSGGGRPPPAPPTRPETADRDGAPPKVIALIEPRAFIRDCLSRSLEARLGETISTYSTTDVFCSSPGRTQARLVILCVNGDANEAEIRRQLLAVTRACEGVPLMLLSEREQPNHIVNAVEMGVRGYLATSLPLEVAAEAIRLVDAGGVFVPAHCLIGGRKFDPALATPPAMGSDFFTARQVAVVDALRRGKANKAIAYELNMRESTVKVHVRNIMKKLKARNRTEVAFLANEILKNE